MGNEEWFTVSTEDHNLRVWLRAVSNGVMYAGADGFYTPAYLLTGELQMAAKLKATCDTTLHLVHHNNLIEAHVVIDRLQSMGNIFGGLGQSKFAQQQLLQQTAYKQAQQHYQQGRSAGLANSLLGANPFN
ncbi:MAG: hypothetical protein DRP93_00180 [Candidatus Neomarinimicrobiota bacterium]|nr:MAG: hypothetical protein DRP93_00180 [Candidatus Neomarinimicrobiota bacterium]